MAVVRNFIANSAANNQIDLSWDQPLDFGNTLDEIIVTRSITHFPVELYNADFPTKATDSRPVEIFRAGLIAGTNTATISVNGNTITDTSAIFPTNPSLKGRLLRDSNSKVHKITSNTATSVTLSTTPANGKYVILADFPQTTRNQQNFEPDIRTEVGVGYVKNLVSLSEGSLILATFEQDELANLIFQDSSGNKYIIKSNTTDTIYFFSASTITVGAGTAILNSFVDSTPSLYLDDYLNESEANIRTGSGLLDDQFYYYTVFTKEEDVNVAQAEYGSATSGVSTQNSAISLKDTNFEEILYNYWPSLYRELDTTGDLQDLMAVFGFQFNQLHSLIKTYKLQDTQNVFVNALVPLSEQTGLTGIGYSIGIDTLRRIAKDLIFANKLKGSKEGIALFIRIITTWDITDGTADYSSAIEDRLPNVEALRFFDAALGSTNTRLTQTSPLVVGGGRFAQSLPGIIIPGFFTFREFVVNLPNVALYLGSSELFSTAENTTTITDTTANFGAIDSLVGNYILPNQEEINDIFEIVANTSTTITVRGIVTNKNPGEYVILSPLNTNRFIILNKLLPLYIPFGTLTGFNFI